MIESINIDRFQSNHTIFHVIIIFRNPCYDTNSMKLDLKYTIAKYSPKVIIKFKDSCGGLFYQVKTLISFSLSFTHPSWEM